MSPSGNSSSSESSKPCSQFVVGAGRKGDRCTTCYEKLQDHGPLPADKPTTALSNPPPLSSGSSNGLQGTQAPTVTVAMAGSSSAPPSTAATHGDVSAVQEIIGCYVGKSGMKLRPRVMLGATSMAKGEAFSGFRTKNSVFPKVRTLGLSGVATLLTTLNRVKLVIVRVGARLTH